MSRWIDQLHFLWEEDAPMEQVRYSTSDQPSGVPRLMRRVMRFSLIGLAASGLMAQIIGIRLVAPVDAAPAYQACCVHECIQRYSGDQIPACIHEFCHEDPEAQQSVCVRTCNEQYNGETLRDCIQNLCHCSN